MFIEVPLFQETSPALKKFLIVSLQTQNIMKNWKLTDMKIVSYLHYLVFHSSTFAIYDHYYYYYFIRILSIITEAATGGVKKVFLKFHKIHRKTPVPESLFFNKVEACNFI